MGYTAAGKIVRTARRLASSTPGRGAMYPSDGARVQRGLHCAGMTPQTAILPALEKNVSPTKTAKIAVFGSQCRDCNEEVDAMKMKNIKLIH